jgi:[protein-PII] uridylyltransferase
LPEWAAIRDRPQRSPLHRHTVDRHSLECVLEAVRLTDRVDRPDLLLMAALCHDLGKRPGPTDHCAAGVPLIREITLRQGWPAGDAAVLRVLVAEHLTPMALATGRDVTDPATARQLARHVGHDAGTLQLLAALTEADARSAGSRAWTAGRAALLRELVARTEAVIDGAGAVAS